jgi:hypothetical protein
MPSGSDVENISDFFIVLLGIQTSLVSCFSLVLFNLPYLIKKIWTMDMYICSYYAIYYTKGAQPFLFKGNIFYSREIYSEVK